MLLAVTTRRGNTLRLKEEDNDSGTRSNCRWEVGLTSNGILQHSCVGEEHAKLVLTFSGKLVIPSQHTGGNVVIPGVTFNASMIIAASARRQLSVTVQLPDLSDACWGVQSSLSFIRCVGKKSLTPNWVPLDFNSCGLDEIWEGDLFSKCPSETVASNQCFQAVSVG